MALPVVSVPNAFGLLVRILPMHVQLQISPKVHKQFSEITFPHFSLSVISPIPSMYLRNPFSVLSQAFITLLCHAHLQLQPGLGINSRRPEGKKALTCLRCGGILNSSMLPQSTYYYYFSDSSNNCPKIIK